MDVTVVPLRRAQFRAAADLLAECYFQEGNVRAVHQPDPRWRRRALRQAFRASLKDAIGQGGPMVALDDADQVVGVALWLPPGAFQLTPVRRAMLILNTLAILWADPSSLSRRRKLTRAKDALHPPEPHWYLAALGVTERERGRGVGSRLMAAGIARADAEAVPCYLETADEGGLAFCREAGFEVECDDAQFVANGPLCWTMWRDAPGH